LPLKPTHSVPDPRAIHCNREEGNRTDHVTNVIIWSQ
jgi:hypothetical protein